MRKITVITWPDGREWLLDEYDDGTAEVAQRGMRPSTWSVPQKVTVRHEVDDGAPDGPDAGHTFRLSVTSRMSSTVVGDEHHTDAVDFFDSALSLEVRAWNLRNACHKASLVPLDKWEHPE